MASHPGRPDKGHDTCLGLPAPPGKKARVARNLIQILKNISFHLLNPTCLATAENFITWSVSSYVDAHWLMLTIMEALPLPQKKAWNSFVSLLSLKGIWLDFLFREQDAPIKFKNRCLGLSRGLPASCYLPISLTVTQSIDALSQDKQGIVDISSLLQPLSERLCFVASFWTSQVTEWEPEKERPLVTGPYITALLAQSK